MALGVSQIRLLTLTARKADCEYGIAVDSMHKMALTREMSQLSNEYYSKLQSKNIAFYANGKYNKMNYQYLMGYGNNFSAVWERDKYALKENNSMILTDYKGQVVLSDVYGKAISDVLGNSAMKSNGSGGTFSAEKIPEILSALFIGISAEDFKTVIEENELSKDPYNTQTKNTLSGDYTGNSTTVDPSAAMTDRVKAIVDFYYPIFAAAATNGWTTEYNRDMANNENYVSDALVTGSFQLTTINNAGEYDENAGLTYFITAGLVESRTDSTTREDVTAWYEAEKTRLNEKETMLDLHMDDLSTELEAINTEIQSIQSLIDDAISSVFDWGS